MTAAGRDAMAETGYCVLTPVIWTLAMRPPCTLTDTLTPPRRLVPCPV
jgi:hypothetical protein